MYAEARRSNSARARGARKGAASATTWYAPWASVVSACWLRGLRT